MHDPSSTDVSRARLLTRERPGLVLGSSHRNGVGRRGCPGEASRSSVATAGRSGASGPRVSGCGWTYCFPRRSLAGDDVDPSPHWLGDVVANSFCELGSPARSTIANFRHAPWALLICFGAIGPGDVSVDGRQVVGISQQRTRDGAHFQCLVLERWDPAALPDLLVLAPAERTRAIDELAHVAAVLAYRLMPGTAFPAELQS